MPPPHLKQRIQTLPQALAIIEMMEQELAAQIHRIEQGERYLQLLFPKYKQAAERLRSSPFRTLDDKIYKEDHLFQDFYETVALIQSSIRPLPKEPLEPVPVSS